MKALAAKQGIEDDNELEKLYSGRSEQKLVVPRGMRDTLRSIGLGDILAPLNLITAVEPQHMLVNETWQDLEFEVALDSGSVVLVIDWESPQVVAAVKKLSWGMAAPFPT